MAHQNWEKVALGDIVVNKGSVSGPFGSNISSKFFTKEGVPVVRGNNLTLGLEGGRYIDNGYVYISPEKADELSKCEARPKDIVLTARGTIGQSGILPDHPRHDRYIISANQLRFRIDEKKADPIYVYYWLSSNNMVKYMQGVQQGVGVPNLNLGRARELPIPLPTLPTQKRIAEILSAFDEKIELNNKINDTLEQMAQAIFKEWFVKFRFPGHEKAKFVDSEMGKIPEGWEVKELSKIAEINPTEKVTRGDPMPYIPMQNLSNNSMVTKYDKLKQFKGGSKFRNGDTLLARITPCLENGKTGYVGCLKENEVGFGSTEFVVLRPRLDVYSEYIYLLVRTREFREFAIGNMVGTSGRQRVAGAIIGTYPIVLISDGGLVEKFHELTEPMFFLINANSEESKKLASLRDLLLPKLMRGEVSI